MSFKTTAFFNHKGGVGKTTVLFNTAVALGAKGHSVLVLDADSQANLSALALSESDYEKAINTHRTIWDAFSPLVSGAGDYNAVGPFQIRANVWITPGDIRLSDFESICPNGWTEALAGQARGFRVTSAPFRLIQELAGRVSATHVFVDVGPNVNALNRAILIACDGFAVPLAPDLFSVRALPSVGTNISNWMREWKTALSNSPELDFDVPVGEPKPIGYITQQFSVYSGSVASAYDKWQSRVPTAYTDGIVKTMARAGVSVPDRADEPIAKIPNFASLVPAAQSANKAVFELTGKEVKGAHITRAAETRPLFEGLADEITKRLT